MATKFSFTEQTFKRIKRAIEAGKSYAEIGYKYDLGTSTLTLINKSATFEEYKRRVRRITAERRARDAARAETRKVGVVLAYIVAAGSALALVITIAVLSSTK